MDYSDHNKVLNSITAAQDADRDNLEHSRECENFLHQRDGQWESGVYEKFKNHPRYTLDLANPIVDQISGQIKKADFAIKVKPSGGSADDDSAKIMAGIVRNIENLSGAQYVYNKAAEGFIGTGVDGWMITQEYSEDDGFNQDLFIRSVPNFIDSVTFDPNSMKQDRSDSEFALKRTAMSRAAFDDAYPKRSGLSLPEDRRNQDYVEKPDQVIIGDFFYIEMEEKTVIKLSNGVVAELEEITPVLDELASQQIVEEDRRTIKTPVVFVRKLDGEGWINKEQRTVFKHIPLIPVYGKFKISNNKLIYRSAIDKALDPCRINNYAYSRIVSDTVLSPKPKIWMTREQAEGEESTLRTMNTNNNPVQFYNHTDGQQSPYQVDGTTTNPALLQIMQQSNQSVTQATGLFAANMGDNPGLQSGVAIESLQEAGSTGTLDWFESMEIAQTHTGRILLAAIPNVYDATRTVRILGEDGSIEEQVINESIMDNQTGQPVIVNDLSKGSYDMTVSVGKSYKSRQEASVAAILEMAQIDPTVIQMGQDILLKNTNAPGLDLIAERFRQQLLQSGVIPQEQWTEEEQMKAQQAQAQAQQQPPQPDPMMLAAQAEMMKAEADMATAQLKQQELQIKGQELQLRAQEVQAANQIKMAELQMRGQKDGLTAQQDQQKFDLEVAALQQRGQKDGLTAQQNQQKFDLDVAKAQQDINIKSQSSSVDNEKKATETEGVELDNMAKKIDLMTPNVETTVIIDPTR
jgi:hypothetical protein